jgi:hypothetical protein
VPPQIAPGVVAPPPKIVRGRPGGCPRSRAGDSTIRVLGRWWSGGSRCFRVGLWVRGDCQFVLCGFFGLVCGWIDVEN